jgi:hypothetical protein
MAMKRVTAAVSAMLLLAGVARTQETTPGKPAATPEALKAEIESLKAPTVAWRGIAWKSCMLDGLRESREKKKPVVLWVFIDRPADDARC